MRFSIARIKNSTRVIFFCVLISLMQSNLAEELPPLELDGLFKNVLQETFPLKDYGIVEPNSIGQLPDGRPMLITESGECYVFNSYDWQKTQVRLPRGSQLIFSDSTGKIWIGGSGFFGHLGPDFVYHDLSKEKFQGEMNTTLSVNGIFETEDWIHFINYESVYHYNTKTQTCKTTHLGGMFNGYLWKWQDQLFLGTKEKVSRWETDHFEPIMDWPHEYRAFVGWTHENKQYFLNATHLHVYDDSGNYLESIKDDLMKMRGATHLMTDKEVILMIQGGLLRIQRDGSCKGWYTPWFHKTITSNDATGAYYYGGDDIWLLTGTAIFRINLSTDFKELAIDTGYHFSGGWDVETFEGSLFATSKQGFRRWNPYTTKEIRPNFEFTDKNSPDFESSNIQKAFGKLLISTWVELGAYKDGAYQIVHSDGDYTVFSKREDSDSLWVAIDHGLRKLNSNLEVIEEWKISERISSIAVLEGAIWISTLDGELFGCQDLKNRTWVDYTSVIESSSDATEHSKKCLFVIEDQLFVLTPKQLWEWKNKQFEKTTISLDADWRWAVPSFANQDNQVVLLQEHPIYSGRKIAELKIDPSTKEPSWDPVFLKHRRERGDYRRIKLLSEMAGNVAALITQSLVEFVEIDSFTNVSEVPRPPKVVSPTSQIENWNTEATPHAYHYQKDQPLTVQLFSEQDSITNPITYFGRLKGQTEWIQSQDGSFSFYGVIRGPAVFEGYTTNAFGQKSAIIQIPYRVIPPWFLRNITIMGYVGIVILLVILIVRSQTKRLRKRAIELQQLVDEQTKDLLEANHAKSIFISNVSHEIRNPLNGLLGLVQNLKEGDVLEDSTLQRLKQPSLYLYRFLSNVLDFSKSDTDQIRFTSQTFDPHDLIASVQNIFAAEFENRGITFVADYRYENHCAVISSQEAIEIVIINLVGNATKYTPQGGMIRLAIRNDNQHLTFSIADTGVGISAQDQERIFEPYAQGTHAPIKGGDKGVGIGLSLVKRTLNQLNGSITVKSEKNKGSIFTCSIPVSTPENSHRIHTIGEVQLSGKYLIVEDLDYNLKLFEDLLQGWGAQTLAAPDGNTAIEIARNTPLNAIFLDFDLPDMTGVEVAKSIRQEPQNSETLIIGLSAYTDTKYIQQGLEAGMDDFLSKPLNPTRLIHCLENKNFAYLQYSTLETSLGQKTHTSISRLTASFMTHEDQLKKGIEDYLETFKSLIVSLKTSDLGSKEFESICHKLKGHSGFINHRISVKYWEHLSSLSHSGKRLELLDALDTLDQIVQALEQEVNALLELHKDYTLLQTVPDDGS